MELKISNLIPETRKIETSETNDKFRVQYKSRKKGGSNSDLIETPKTIHVSPELSTALGIYYAEGNKSPKRRSSSFSNSEPSVISAGLQLFKSLGIKEAKAHIMTYNTDVSNETLIEYWSDVSGISKENFIKTTFLKSKESYQRNRKRPPKYGVLEIYFSSVVIRDIIDNLIAELKKIIKNRKILRRCFLQGLFAGEGSVKLSRQSKLREIRVSCCNKNEQRFIRNIIKKGRIMPSNAEYKFYVAISNRKNFKKLYKINIFQIHPIKKSLFELGLKNLLSGE